MAQTRTKAAPRKRGRASPLSKEKLEFVQDFIPLKELKNGIVETTDGRFIKILEIEPINFLLRSDEEQWGIISTFASWLKISPMRLQFKSVTRKADSDQYVAGLQADLEQEVVDACRQLGEGTIRFIREEGSREALSRRFFLIFQYEAASRRQEAALRSTMPFLYMDASLERKSKRNVLTSGAASTYMFTSFELSDDNGILLGLNRHNNSLCIVDPFNTKVNKNANFTICGTSGAGKTYTMQVMALRMRMRGIQCFILAPLKGHEFKRACHKVGGAYIKLAPGSTACINVMEIRPTITPEMELIDELDYSDIDSMLARKVQQLMIFFSLLIPDMNNEEEQMLDEALIKTYTQFGITHDNASLYIDASRTTMKPMPILGDLYENLKENPLTTRLATIVSRFVTGSAQSFNRQTNVDLSNKYIVLDISELKGKLLPVGMMIALDYVWDQVKADRTKRKMVFIDEIWKLIGGAANKQAAEFCLEIFKIIRGYGGGALAATQDLSDFFGLEDGRYGRAILNNSKTKIILNLEPDEAEYVKDVLKLTRTEIRSITQFERGEALISSNSNKVPVIIKASREEQQMITTDRAELEAMLTEMKAVADLANQSGIPADKLGISSKNVFTPPYTHEMR